LKAFFKMLSKHEAQRVAADPKKKEQFWELHMPDYKKIKEGKFKRNEQFIYGVWALLVHLNYDETRKLLAIAIGKWINLPDEFVGRFFRQSWDSVLGIYDVGREGANSKRDLKEPIEWTEEDKCSYGLRDPIATRKLWSRYVRRYFKMGTAKKKGKKGSDEKVKNKKKKRKERVEVEDDEHEATEVKSKKSKWRDKIADEVDDDDDEQPKRRNKKNKEKKKLKLSSRKKEKKENKSNNQRLPNITEEARLIKTGDHSFRGKLGELYELIPRKSIRLGKLLKLAKKKKMDPTRTRQYISIFRRAGAVKCKE